MTDNKQDNKKQNSPTNPGNKLKPKFSVYWIYGLIAVVFIGMQLLIFTPKPQDITMQEF